MNCPSKNDNVLLNPTWNESPPRFAADLTTCADLNGIANARELGDADRLSNDSGGFRSCESDGNRSLETEKQRSVLGKGAEGPQKGNVILMIDDEVCSQQCRTLHPNNYNGQQ
jgi:zinc transporter 1/2/3